MTARLLMIGLDGADGCTLERASRDATLPNLAALRARGQAWELSSPHGATDDALWASFQYGADLGEHGRYFFQIPEETGLAVMRELDRETFWDTLSRQELRVAVLDVPKCRPPRSLNGIHLADWLVHGRYYNSPLSYPEALAADVVARFGAPPPSRCAYEPPVLSDDEVRAVRDNLYRAVGQKRAAGLHYLAQEPWDLFIIGFKEAHCGCHMFWEFADPTHAKHDVERVARLGNPVLDVLKVLDAAVGDLVAAAGPEANVVVFSTSDFAPNGSILHLMPEIVERVNRYMTTRGGERIERALRRLLRRGAPPPACGSLFYSDNAGALRVHHRRVDTARHHARRLDLIATLACELVDVDDGRPVVSAVTRPAYEHAGASADRLPHLLLHFRSNICSRAVTSAHLGRIEAPPPGNIRSGNHTAGGFALAAGPAACAAAAEVRSLEDFASLAARVLHAGEQKMATTESAGMRSPPAVSPAREGLVFPNEHLEMRQDARVIAKSKED
ncbi:MAG: alkaline phosphatase family protein [Xanthobacteraceae bacterium]